MPTSNTLRLRLITILKEDAPIARRVLLRRFNTSDRAQANTELGLLISDGFLIVTGLGLRGNPETISLGPNWPADRCPMCHQTINKIIRAA